MAHFRVTAAGAVDYDAGISYLRGRGEKTLTLHGCLVYVDATRLTASRLYIAGVVSNWDRQRLLPARVLPATYQLGADGKWSDATFNVTTAGKVDYHATYLSGAGTETLTILTSTLPGTG
jgi:hypothetical protein